VVWRIEDKFEFVSNGFSSLLSRGTPPKCERARTWLWAWQNVGGGKQFLFANFDFRGDNTFGYERE
jgi:hypothetical protein